MSERDPETKIKILFLAANPRDTNTLALDREVSKIKDRLAESRLRDQFDLEQEWTVQLDELSRLLLDHRPHIVHFSGHGSSRGELIFEDASGAKGQSTPIGAIADLFRILKDNVRVVLLNACFSEEQARAIAKHIDCVIGTSTAIGDQVAIAFAAGFYRALGYNKDLQAAFELGCYEIDIASGRTDSTREVVTIDSPNSTATRARAGSRDHLIPQLVAREGVDPRTITLHSDATDPLRSDAGRVSVLEDAELVDTEVGNVVAEKSVPGGAHGGAGIGVLNRARLERSKLGDITARDSRGTPESDQ